MYKDLVSLIEDGSMMTEHEKRFKVEACFRGDRLVASTAKMNGTNFCEVREWRGIAGEEGWEDSFLIRFIFVTRVFSEGLKTMISTYCEDHFPDVIYIQSTFWDVTRYGDGEEIRGQRYFPQFTYNLRLLVDHVDELYKAENERREKENQQKRDKPLKIWRSALPISRHTFGGLVEEIQFGGASESFRRDIGFANVAAQKVIETTDWAYLDAHYMFRKIQNQDKLRENDGVHWNQIAHRWLSFLFLKTCCEEWGYEIETPVDIKDEKEGRNPSLERLFGNAMERALTQRRKYRAVKRKRETENAAVAKRHSLDSQKIEKAQENIDPTKDPSTEEPDSKRRKSEIIPRNTQTPRGGGRGGGRGRGFHRMPFTPHLPQQSGWAEDWAPRDPWGCPPDPWAGPSDPWAAPPNQWAYPPDPWHQHYFDGPPAPEIWNGPPNYACPGGWNGPPQGSWRPTVPRKQKTPKVC